MEFYSAIRKNETIWFEGKWIQLEDIMLSEVKPGSERQSLLVFSHMWRMDPKDKHKNKNKYITCKLL
jgi:hypothetical protein